VAQSANVRFREANGRFRRQREEVEHGNGVGHIALLSVALVVGAAGFAFPLLWVGALVLMGILWGSLASEWQRQAKTRKGVVAEVVDAVVEQAKEVADSASAKPSARRREP
jgi:hypothetical protein